MADRTRLNREIAEQHGGGATKAKVPGRDTNEELQEPHAVEGEQVAGEQPAAEQQASEPQRRRSVFDAPLQADLDAQSRDRDKTDPADE